MLQNVISFYEMYPDEAGAALVEVESKHVLDVWIRARLAQLIEEITNGLDAYDTAKASRPIRAFIEDLSTWYVRRSRDRFKSDDSINRTAAITTMRHVLRELAKAIAPFMPFIAERMYKVVGGERESVHLEDWPEIRQQGDKATILEDMQVVRNTVSLALEARMKVGVKIRQPLASLKIRSTKSEIRKNSQLVDLIKDELNVKDVVFDDGPGWEVELDTTITPELKREGDIRELSRAIQDFRKTSGLTPSDKIALVVTTDAEGKTLVESAREELMKATGLTSIEIIDGETGFAFSIQATS